MTSPLGLNTNLKSIHSQPPCQSSFEHDRVSEEQYSSSRLPGFFQNKIFIVFINQAVLIEYKTSLREIPPQEIANNACKAMGIEIANFLPELYDQNNSSIVTTTSELKNAAIYFLLFKPDSVSPAAETKAKTILKRIVTQLQVSNYNDLKLAPELKHGYNKVTSLPTPGFRFNDQESDESCSPSNGRQHYLLARCAKSRRSFFCPLITCLKQSKHSGDLRIHFRTHTGEKPFDCHFCSAKFLKKTQLHQHLKESTTSSLNKCPQQSCQRIFSTQCQLLEHIRSHSQDQRRSSQIRLPLLALEEEMKVSQHFLLCPLCPRRFTNPSDYQLHLQLHKTKQQQETSKSYEAQSIKTLHKILLIKHLLIYCYEQQMQKVVKNASTIGDRLMAQLNGFNIEPIFATEPTYETSQSSSSIETFPINLEQS